MKYNKIIKIIEHNKIIKVIEHNLKTICSSLIYPTSQSANPCYGMEKWGCQNYYLALKMFI